MVASTSIVTCLWCRVWGGEFSQPGDSGALVYTNDLHALGFVIGGAGELGFVSRITCMDELKLELVL
jgi:hypothetical protein